MKKFLLTVSMTSSLFANEIDLDNLLDDFANENDLSNTTKVEKSGTMQLVVYTREDLDRLHYQSLKDILNMQRFFTYRESRFGYSDLVKSEPMRVGKAGTLVKVYIDDFELSTLQYDTASHVLGNIELNFVNHVEVYQGPPSFEISTKASLMVIKLYTKNPQRDSGNKVGVLSDNYGSYSTFFHTANADDDLKYFLYMSKSDFQREVIKNGDTDLSRDEVRKHLMSTFEYKENKIHLQYIEKKQDGFLTNSWDATPTKDDIEQSFLNIGYKKDFLEDRSATFKANYTRTIDTVDFMDDQPLPILSQLASLKLMVPTFVYGEEYKSKDEIASVSINKKLNLKNHEIFMGINYTSKKLTDIQNDYVVKDFFTQTYGTIPTYNTLTKQNLYSIYVQDAYRVTQNNTLLLALKLEKENSSYFDNETLLTSRVSHTYETNNFTFMTYYTKMPVNKISYLFNSNSTKKDLKNEYITLYGHETKYKIDNFDISYNIMDFKLYNMFYMDNNGFYNSENQYKIIFNSLRLNYTFSDKHSLMLDLWREDVNMEEDQLQYYKDGLSMRFLNTFEKLTFANEFVFLRTNEEGISDQNEWQYNLGITYKYTKDLTFFVKGENIFDNRAGYQYLNYKNDSEAIDSIEERYSFGMEYTF